MVVKLAQALDPEQLLSFLSSIQSIQEINIKLIKVATDEQWEEGNVPITVNLNGYEYTCWIFSGLTEVTGAFHFMAQSQKAYLIAAESIFDTLQDWYENEYTDWVRNDTGYGIKEEFSNLIIAEIDRINNFFE